MTTTTLLPFLVLLAIAWLWLAGARAREFATNLAKRYCGNRNLQFLDDTVSLVRFGVRWTGEGLRVRRMFRFEFSLEGVGRRSGYVLMLGTRLERIDDGLPVPADQEPERQEETKADTSVGERKVIPFERKKP